MSRFQVGDKVKVVHCINGPINPPWRTVITKVMDKPDPDGLVYEIDIPSGNPIYPRFWVKPAWLMIDDYDGNMKTSWHTCPWKPPHLRKMP